MKTYIKYLLFAIFVGWMGVVHYIGAEKSVACADIIFQFSFSGFHFDIGTIPELLRYYFGIILFQVFFGTYIYRHFTSASVYYFSRCSNRIQWFLKESVFLFVYVMIYVVLTIGSGIFIVNMTAGVTFQHIDKVLLFYYVLFSALWLYAITLTVNILAIILDSSRSFMVVGGFQMFCMAVFSFFDIKGDVGQWLLENNHFLLFQWNPVFNLCIPWHSSKIEEVNKKINWFQIPFDLNWSAFYFVLLAVVSIIVGCIIVKKIEFVTVNKEGGDA